MRLNLHWTYYIEFEMSYSDPQAKELGRLTSQNCVCALRTFDEKVGMLPMRRWSGRLGDWEDNMRKCNEESRVLSKEGTNGLNHSQPRGKVMVLEPVVRRSRPTTG